MITIINVVTKFAYSSTESIVFPTSLEALIHLQHDLFRKNDFVLFRSDSFPSAKHLLPDKNLGRPYSGGGK